MEEDRVTNQNLHKCITEILVFKIRTSKFMDDRPGLGSISNRPEEAGITSLRNGLRRNSTKWLSCQLSNHENLSAQNIARLNSDTKKVSFVDNYIRLSENDSLKQKDLIHEFHRRLPSIGEKIDKAIGKAATGKEAYEAKRILDDEIGKCKSLIRLHSEKMNTAFFVNQYSRSDVKGYDVVATINEKGTGQSVTVYAPVELDKKHQLIYQHYTDMSKAQLNSIHTAANIGVVTPDILWGILLDKARCNDFTLATQIGVTGKLKDFSLAKFNQDVTAMNKIITEIKSRLVNYINVENGRIPQVGQSKEQTMLNHQMTGLHL